MHQKKKLGNNIIQKKEKELKNDFKEIFKIEISESVVHKKVTETIKQIDKKIDKVVFSAPVKTVQGPVKTQFGYHLLEVTSRTE